MGVGGQCHAPAVLPPGKTRYPLYRRLGGPRGPVRTGAENLAPTGIRSPDRPARSESLYRLSHPSPTILKYAPQFLLKSVPARHPMLANLADNFLFSTYSRPSPVTHCIYPGGDFQTVKCLGWKSVHLPPSNTHFRTRESLRHAQE